MDWPTRYSEQRRNCGAAHLLANTFVEIHISCDKAEPVKAFLASAEFNAGPRLIVKCSCHLGDRVLMVDTERALYVLPVHENLDQPSRWRCRCTCGAAADTLEVGQSLVSIDGPLPRNPRRVDAIELKASGNQPADKPDASGLGVTDEVRQNRVDIPSGKPRWRRPLLFFQCQQIVNQRVTLLVHYRPALIHRASSVASTGGESGTRPYCVDIDRMLPASRTLPAIGTSYGHSPSRCWGSRFIYADCN